MTKFLQRTLTFSTRNMSNLLTDDVYKAKKALRKMIRKKVSEISAEEKKFQSDCVVQQILKSNFYQNAKAISVYLNMEDEIQTELIVKRAFLDGKICYIPKYYIEGQGNLMELVKLKDMEDFHNLPKTKWNIKQPSNDDKREEALEKGCLDLILVPGMAFTSQGHRLGRGKGYYDTYLAKAKSKGLNPTTVALAFSQQVLPEIPTTEHDELIDQVIFPKV